MFFVETKVTVSPPATAEGAENDNQPPQYVSGQNGNAYVSSAVLQHTENLAKRY